MRCPRCDASLTPQPAGRKATLHACGDHHGVFATEADLTHVLPVAAHAALRDASARAAPGDLPCPSCASPMAMFVATRGRDRIELDACPTCLGTWFDGGELERVKRAPQTVEGPAATRRSSHAMGLAGDGTLAAGVGVEAIGGIFQLIASLLDW